MSTPADRDSRTREPPTSLLRLQRGFGQSIARPLLLAEDGTGDYRLDITAYDLDVLHDIRPRGNSEPAERLGIYNQQYWFRLLGVMQEEYPLTEQLLGTLEFNRMVMAFLSRTPPSSASLNHLSDGLLGFLDLAHRWNRPLWREAAQLEYLFIRAFDARHLPPLDPRSLTAHEQTALLQSPVRMQPHWFLFSEHWNLVEWRKWLKRRTPTDHDDGTAPVPIEQRGYWAVYRGDRGTVAEPLGRWQFELLTLLQAGRSLGDACELLLAEATESDVQFIAENIQGWFASWSTLGWFAAPTPPG